MALRTNTIVKYSKVIHELRAKNILVGGLAKAAKDFSVDANLFRGLRLAGYLLKAGSVYKVTEKFKTTKTDDILTEIVKVHRPDNFTSMRHTPITEAKEVVKSDKSFEEECLVYLKSTGNYEIYRIQKHLV